jgi:large conductance mechanosensitive channel
MSLLKEFKQFAMRGNVVDLAVAVVIGAAFGKVITSFVADVLMPPIGMLLGGTDFANMEIVLKEAQGEVAAVTWRYGAFVQNIVDFLIIAASIFMVIKIISSAKKKEAASPPPSPVPTKEEELLREIRDLLKK